jgi:hypothetical protein
MIKNIGNFGEKRAFLAVNEVGPENVIRHIADQKIKSKAYHSLCSFFACSQLRILCPLRYRTRAFHQMASGHDIREGNHTQRKYTGY